MKGMERFGRAAFAVLAMLATPAFARDEIDTTFGNAGFVRHGFGALPGGSADDWGTVACPGPLGSLYVAGTASGDRRFASLWLDEHGAPDPRFSGDGQELIDLPANYGAFGETGLCQSDGKVVVAFELTDAAGAGTLTLLRLDPATGRPDPTFGQAGFVSIDISPYAGGLNLVEVPTFLSPGRDGDVLVGGWYEDVRGNAHGYLARVTRSGAVGAVTTAPRFDTTVSAFGAAVPSPDGALWAATAHGAYPGMPATLVRLDYASLKFLDVLQPSLGDGFVPRSGRLVGDVLVLAGRVNTATPAISVLRAHSRTTTVLPAIPGANDLVAAQVVPQANGRLVLAAHSVDAHDRGYGYYFAALTRQPDDLLTLDPAFGNRGVQYTTPTVATGCAPANPVFLRMTLWQDRPVWVGSVDVCAPGMPRHRDFLALRLKSPAP